MNSTTVAPTRDIFQFVARNADIADAHQFSREHKSAINSALSRAGLPTLGGRATQTMGHLRTLVHGAEVVASRPERTVAERVEEAVPALRGTRVISYQGFAHAVPERKAVAHEPVTPERVKEPCMGINLSASSAHAECKREQESPWCWQHKGQRGRTRTDLLAERARNIAQAEREREEYLARKEALATLADLHA